MLIVEIPKVNKEAQKILNQIARSVVVGKSRRLPDKKKREGFHFEDEEKLDFRIDNFRSDATQKKISSADTRRGQAKSKEKDVYTGTEKLAVGLGYNKGGLQVLLETEIKDAGKKTSQLE